MMILSLSISKLFTKPKTGIFHNYSVSMETAAIFYGLRPTCTPKFFVPPYSELSLRLVPFHSKKHAGQNRWKYNNNNNTEKETEEKQYVTRHCRSGDIIIIQKKKQRKSNMSPDFVDRVT